jgi:protoporphyrinogen oxidase
MILVLGGGVTGLAAARALKERGAEFLVLEREREPGGWCRSIRSGGYLFDMSGHFLHLSDPAMRAMALGLPGVSWNALERDARVFLRGRLTPYPFQANLHGHSAALVRRCLADFARERIREATGTAPAPRNFEEWLVRRFGRMMCREFFFPYNRKMWRTPLRDMEYSWTSWSVPVPAFEDILAGARGEIRKGMGYNPSFLYPCSGGMNALVSALAGPLRDRLRTGTEIVRIDTERRVAWSAGGDRFPYDAMVATAPLPALAAACGPASRTVRAAAGKLRWVKVLSLNFGIRDPEATFGHWVYVPERAYPFFRVGFLSNVFPGAAPGGCASVFTEKSFPAEAEIDVRSEVRASLAHLVRMGVLRKGRVPEVVEPIVLDPAYVVFDHAREKAVKLLLERLRGKGIFAAGRYGSWDYNGMEGSMADGIRAAGEAFRAAGGGAA